MAGTAKAVFTISLHNDRHKSGCIVAGARPKQALAYPTQHTFLSQMWRTLVAYSLLHSAVEDEGYKFKDLVHNTRDLRTDYRPCSPPCIHGGW